MKCKGGKYVVEKDEKIIKEIPANMVESVNVYSGANITSPCIYRMIDNGVLITWFNSSNQIIGCAENIHSVNSELMEKQILFRKKEDLCLELSKKVINAKLINASVILRRFNRNRDNEKIEVCKQEIKKNIKEIGKVKSIIQLYGIEGIGSRHYFEGVKEILGKELMFDRRSKRPPKDAFNSLLSFGYSILYSEILVMIKKERLSPYYGFMHNIRNGHASLASDIMEEFRYQLVDSVAISSLNNREFKAEDFSVNNISGGVYLDKELRKKYIFKIISKINDNHKYNNKIETYRQTIQKQIKTYKSIINTNKTDDYNGFVIR